MQGTTLTLADTVALGSLLLNILVAFAGLTWGLSRVRGAIAAEIESKSNHFDEELHDIELRMGEVSAALRQKVTEVELYTRDTFMRRDVFHETLKAYGADVRSGFEKIDARLERMEAKIDTKS